LQVIRILSPDQTMVVSRERTYKALRNAAKVAKATKSGFRKNLYPEVTSPTLFGVTTAMTNRFVQAQQVLMY